MDMSCKRKTPREGDLFCVPLGAGGYGVGLVARSKGPAVLAYLFGPRCQSRPSAECARGLASSRAILVARVAVRKLRNGAWPILGQVERWSRDAWPMPLFASIDLLHPDTAYVRHYGDANLVIPVAQRAIPSREAGSYLSDGIYGSEALEAELDELL
jgi:hypothetical protein